MRKTSLAKIGQIILAKSPDKYYQLMYDLAWSQDKRKGKGKGARA